MKHPSFTPEYLTEIERKARAYQAEEAANPDAKTCQRPTPELVLRLVEECKVLRAIISESAQALGNGSHVEGCSTWLMAQLPKEIALVVGELRAKVAELEAACTRWAERAADSTADRERARELQARAERAEASLVCLYDKNKELQAIVDRLPTDEDADGKKLVLFQGMSLWYLKPLDDGQWEVVEEIVKKVICNTEPMMDPFWVATDKGACQSCRYYCSTIEAALAAQATKGGAQ